MISRKQKELLQAEVHVLLDMFRRLVRRRAKSHLVKLLEKTHPADLALVFRQLVPEERQAIFALMGTTEQTGRFLAEVDSAIASPLLDSMEPHAIVQLLSHVGSDDKVALLNLLSPEKSEAVLKLMKAEESEELQAQLTYRRDSAGEIMSVDVFHLPETTKVGDAIKTIQESQEAEMVFYVYVTDERERLTGVVSLRELVTAPPDTLLTSIMTANVISVSPDTDQEEVARMVSRYNLLAIPVVDSDQTLLGIVTVDDIVDVIREEATEDFLQMAGLGKDREILLKSTWENAKARLPWLTSTWIGGVIVSWIAGSFEPILMSTVALPAFIPVILGMGGNIGTQSSTIMVRGIATGRVHLGQMGRMVIRELQVGLLLGGIYGILLGVIAHLRFIEATPLLGVVVGLSICASMLIAACIGAFWPLLLRRLDIDPAISSGPFVTTSTDMIGIVSYFLIASLLLPAAV